MISTTSLFQTGPRGTKRTGERGQISIFFASSLIVLISIIAFIINIGLFVKAKINLQNAVDASAYAGAAVQARMLNRVGYMNWEMRNNYKEWMFKYWVLGNLNIDNVSNPSTITNDRMRFTMQPDPNVAIQNTDPYNFPSVCLHYAGVPTNVCKRYALPGIPRFEPTNLVGIDETTSSFIDAIVREKSDDCSKRSRLNFNVTNMWAYQVVDRTGGPNNAFADAPQVAADRPGAWPMAVELAMRTRNLEYAINREPIRGVCVNQGAAASSCASPIGALTQEKNYGNERPVKAFYSGFRNLGNDADREMKNSFTLTELSPTPVTFPQLYDISTALMLNAAKSRPKYYVDLKLMMVNYATFFTALISRSDNIQVSGQTVGTQGACDVSKIAVPVPGYPLGFYKNPDVVTYYAVKGQARFQGLFNPFSNFVVMTAWAAAKPMGGRVGPAVFVQKSPSETSMIKSRSTQDKTRSSSYIAGIDLSNVPRKGAPGTVPVGQYAPGMPIPINTGSNPSERFWIANDVDTVGGWISGPEIVFGIPNLPYNYIGNDFSNSGYDGSSATTVINPGDPSAVTTYGNGLFRSQQFAQFSGNLVASSTPAEVNEGIERARAPTLYEAANYTIPTPSDKHTGTPIDGGFSDTFGFATGPVAGTVDKRVFSFYAPLHGNNGDVMFKNAADVIATVSDFIRQQEPAMTKYRDSMNKVALSIYSGNPTLYRSAAERISDFDFTASPTSSNPKTCNSIAGQFLFYYFGAAGAGAITGITPAGCPRSLMDTLSEYFSTGLGGNFDKYMYTMNLTVPPDSTIKFQNQLTGYMPGPTRGADEKGQFKLPFGNIPELESMRRAGYSTKFVTLKSLTRGGGYSTPNLAIYSEGKQAPLTDVPGTSFLNALDASANIPSTVTH